MRRGAKQGHGGRRGPVGWMPHADGHAHGHAHTQLAFRAVALPHAGRRGALGLCDGLSWRRWALGSFWIVCSQALAAVQLFGL